MHKLDLLNTQKVMFYLIETLSLMEFNIVSVKDILMMTQLGRYHRKPLLLMIIISDTYFIYQYVLHLLLFDIKGMWIVSKVWYK